MTFDYFYEEHMPSMLFWGTDSEALESQRSIQQGGICRNMNGIDIQINLDPINDGIAFGKAFDPDRMDKRALIIGTNGKYRLISIREAERLLHVMRECSGSIYLKNSEYLVVYNADKTFESEGSEFFIGSMLILRADGARMLPLSEDEIKDALHRLDDHMAEFCAYGQTFQALEVGYSSEVHAYAE